MQELISAGFSAHLVGGCVRDLLLDKTPKDFDVATNAWPEQVKRLFPRSRVFGRRFRLAEVRVKGELIQVATYRASPSKAEKGSNRPHVSYKGRLLRDNTYGTIEEDAFRRDLTINSLYLDPSTMDIIDYTNGYQDARNGIIRVIGDPAKRYQEDPVRILRAIRFAAMLNFKLESKSEEQLSKLGHLLRDISNARMADEIKKLFLSGFAQPIYQKMHNCRIFSFVFPSYANYLNSTSENKFNIWLEILFSESDQRVNQREHLSLTYTFAAILWQPYRKKSFKSQGKGNKLNYRVADNLLFDQSKCTYLPRHIGERIQDIWRLQYILEQKDTLDSEATSNKNFRPALRLLELRSRFGEVKKSICDRWVPLRDSQKHSSQSQRRHRQRRRQR